MNAPTIENTARDVRCESRRTRRRRCRERQQAQALQGGQVAVQREGAVRREVGDTERGATERQ